MQQFGVSADGAGKALAGAGVAAGALAAVKFGQFAIDAANEVTELAGTVRDFQRASGASAEDSSRWVAALDDLGIAADKGGAAAFKLGREIAQGGDKLREFGIEIERNRDGTPDLTGTLLNAADAFKETDSQAEKAELAMALFGKAGKDLIPLLEQGHAGLKRFFEGAEVGGQIFSQDQLDHARQYELAIDDLQDSIPRVSHGSGLATIPVLTEFSQTASTAIGVFNKGRDTLGGFADEAFDFGVRQLPVSAT